MCLDLHSNEAIAGCCSKQTAGLTEIAPQTHKLTGSCSRSGTMEMEWTNELTFEFLNIYRSEPSLWNCSTAEHKNKNDLYEAWRRIKMQLRDGNIPIQDIKKKRDNLMSTYRRLRTKVTHSQAGGEDADGASDIYRPEWPFYQTMSSFLDDVYIPKKSRYSEGIELPDMVQYGINPEGSKSGKGKRYSKPKSPNKGKRTKSEKVEEPEMPMEDSYNYLSMIAQTQHSDQDDCALYTSLLCKKLRTLRETTREKVMLEIDRFIYSVKQQESMQPSAPAHPTHSTPSYPLQLNVSPSSYQLAYSPQLSPNSQYAAHPKCSPHST